MGIFEIASELGKAIKADERYVRFEAAKKAYEECAELQKNLIEYEVQQTALHNEYSKEEKDMVFIEAIQKRIDELYKLVTESDAFILYNQTQEGVNALMQKVNSDINFYAFGERPCTHDCSSCSSDCASKKA